MSITKKTALVTGGAGAIGSAWARRLLERGYRVVLADLNKQNGAKIEAELGADSLFVHCDVGSWESQAEMFKKATEWGGRIDVFIANAGIEERERFYILPGDKDSEPVKPNIDVVEVNLSSVLYGLRLFRHYNRKFKIEGETAKMLLTSSWAGFYDFPAAPVYAAAKHGLTGLVRSAAFKLRRDESILINAIGPGPVDTPISAEMKKHVAEEKFTPMAHVVKALDLALDSDMTGETIECTNEEVKVFKFGEKDNPNSVELIGDMKRF